MAITETTITTVTCDLDGVQIPLDRVVRLALADKHGGATRFDGLSPRKADVCPDCAAKPGLAELLDFLRSTADPEEVAALMSGAGE